MDNNMNQSGEGMNKGKVCNCPHHMVVPWAIILIGVVVILSAFNILSGMWQLLILGVLLVVIGGTKLFGRKCGCCNR